MVTHICKYTKTHWTLHFKWVKCIVCELYLNKAVTEKIIKKKKTERSRDKYPLQFESSENTHRVIELIQEKWGEAAFRKGKRKKYINRKLTEELKELEQWIPGCGDKAPSRPYRPWSIPVSSVQCDKRCSHRGPGSLQPE